MIRKYLMRINRYLSQSQHLTNTNQILVVTLCGTNTVSGLGREGEGRGKGWGADKHRPDGSPDLNAYFFSFYLAGTFVFQIKSLDFLPKLSSLLCVSICSYRKTLLVGIGEKTISIDMDMSTKTNVTKAFNGKPQFCF